MARIQPNPRFRAVDPNTGAGLAAGKLYTYEAGTTTPKATFADQAGTIPNTNPVILDGNGEANIWLSAGAYKFVLHDAFDVHIWTVDGIQVPDTETLAALTVTGATTLAAVTVSGQITSTVATGTAPLVVSSTTKVANLNADLLKDKTWAAPDPIGATTPATGKFTTLEMKRLLNSLSTPHGVGDYALGGNWGTTPSVSFVNAVDHGGRITVTSGSGAPGANPTITLTFKDGAFGSPPFVACGRADVNTPAGGYWALTAISTTQATWTFVGTPAASTAYVLDFVIIGRS